MRVNNVKHNRIFQNIINRKCPEKGKKSIQDEVWEKIHNLEND